ncbi:MAG TPA: crossover junction endodeoxyribonuclease RuvC [Gammaproteobacteria bacterium]|jgi:crossover junction endodeoxyribonuclease RuvC|nr:crossover junction endodeoxyribonuclease RuvC [Gammaproteobacteria bacterium]
MTTIIGIDPGSRRTGYGVIQLQGSRHRYVASGFLNLAPYPACERLRQIFIGLQQIIQTYQPDEAAIEQVFMHENPNSALKLGQARGAAIVALTMPMAEYSARAIKKSVVGHGAANKEQVQYMVKCLLNLEGQPQADAADALAVALCHAQVRGSFSRERY